MKMEVDSRYNLKSLEKIAYDANKHLPTMVDEATRLEKVVAQEKVLEKQYTLVNSGINQIDVLKFEQNISKILKEQSCVNEQSITLYNNNVTEWFTYFDKNGALIATIKVNNSSCQ